MAMADLKDMYTTKELAQLLGLSVKSVLARARREGWQGVQGCGLGGGNRWSVSSQPPATRDAIASAMLREARAAAASAPNSNTPAIVGGTVGTAPAPELTRASDRERTVATARLAFVREIERLAGLVGKEKAIRHLIEASCSGHLDPTLMSLVTTATACKRGGTLSRRSLYRWASDYAEGGEAALLPAFRKSEPLPVWFDEFLPYYQKPQCASAPTIASAQLALSRPILCAPGRPTRLPRRERNKKNKI